MCQDYDDDPGDYYRDDRDGADVFDEADYEYRKAEEAHWEHCEQVHGGQRCDCLEPLRRRLRYRLSEIRRWIDMRRHPDRYDTEPPF